MSTIEIVQPPEVLKCELLDGLWPLFIIGKFLGMINLKKNNSTELVCNYKSFFVIYLFIFWFSYTIVFLFAVIILIRGLKTSNAFQIVEQLLDLVFHLHIVLNTSICISESQNYPKLFKKWMILDYKIRRLESFQDFECCKTRSHWHLKAAQLLKTGYMFNLLRNGSLIAKMKEKFPQSNFVLLCWLTTLSYTIIASIAAGSYLISVQIRAEHKTTEEYLAAIAEIYILKEHSNNWTGILFLIFGFLMELAWAYGDMLIFMFSFSLHYQYRRYNETLEILQKYNPSLEELELLRATHWEIALGIKEADERLGLVTAISFTFNILFLFSRVYLGLSADIRSGKPFIVFETIYYVGYLIIRIFLSAILASNLYTEANKTLDILMGFYQQDIQETHFLLMERFASQILTGKVCFNGNGYFILNRSFIVSILSAMVTFEVVILQFSASTKK